MVSNVSVPRIKILPCETFYRRSLSFGLAAFRHRLQYILILSSAAIKTIFPGCNPIPWQTLSGLGTSFAWCIHCNIYKELCEVCFFQLQLAFFRSCSVLNIALVRTSATFHAQSSVHEECHVFAAASGLMVHICTFCSFFPHNFASLQIVPTSFLFFFPILHYDGPYNSFPCLYSYFFPNHAQWYQTFPFQG